MILSLQLESLNLGNNQFEDIPEVLGECIGLLKLQIFGNRISKLEPATLGIWKIFYIFHNKWNKNAFTGSLRNVTVLNLNNNQLKEIPPEICRWLINDTQDFRLSHIFFCFRVVNLKHLTVENNQLTELPFELCANTSLVGNTRATNNFEIMLFAGLWHIDRLFPVLNAASNQLVALPLEIGYLVNLERLHLQKNKIKELPEVTTQWSENIHVLQTPSHQWQLPTQRACILPELRSLLQASAAGHCGKRLENFSNWGLRQDIFCGCKTGDFVFKTSILKFKVFKPSAARIVLWRESPASTCSRPLSTRGGSLVAQGTHRSLRHERTQGQVKIRKEFKK